MTTDQLIAATFLGGMILCTLAICVWMIEGGLDAYIRRLIDKQSKEAEDDN